MSRIAFLGLGAIGAPMARHLAAPPWELAVWNRTPEKATAVCSRPERSSPYQSSSRTSVAVVGSPTAQPVSIRLATRAATITGS